MEFLKIWEILLRRKWIIISVFLAFFFIVVIGTHLLTPTYEAKAKLLVGTTDSLSLLLTSLDFPIPAPPDDYETDIALSTIRPILEELISSLKLKKRNGELIKYYELAKPSLINKILPKPSVEVDQYEDAAILEIVSNSPDPSEAANMSNKLAELYIKDRLERSAEEYKAARIFIEGKIQKIREEYYEALSDVKNFRIKEETVDLATETEKLIDKITSLKSNFEENEKAILGLENEIAKSREQLEKTEKFRKDSEEFALSDQVKDLKTKINDILISISGKSVDFRKDHPDYMQLEKQFETAKELIKSEAKLILDRERLSVDPIYEELSQRLVEGYIEREVAVGKRALIQRYLNEYQDELLKIPLKKDEESKLALALEVKKEMYKKVLDYLVHVDIGESMILSNIRLVEAATKPDKPNFPKKALNYVLGLFLGLFWGLGVGFFMEYIDNTIKSPEDLKHIKTITMLGTIPRSRLLKHLGIIANLDPTLPVIEAFKTIKNNIQYTSVDKPVKTILVTSSVEQEGKSSLATNLSITFAMEEKRVILVDFNLRRPSIHKFFNTPNERGITNVLGEGLNLKKAIVHTEVEGLYLLPSGPIPPDPSRLVESQRVKKDIIRALKERFDVVVIDSPPAMTINDAIVIGQVADGILFLIESGKATISMVENIKEHMEKASLNLIGVILNKFKAHGASFYQYYYDRYYKK